MNRRWFRLAAIVAERKIRPRIRSRAFEDGEEDGDVLADGEDDGDARVLSQAAPDQDPKLAGYVAEARRAIDQPVHQRGVGPDPRGLGARRIRAVTLGRQKRR